MKLNWIGNQRYYEYNSKATVRTINTPLRMSIHKYVGCKDELFFTCHELGINNADLHTTDLEKAEEQAMQLMEQHLSELNARVTKILETYRNS